MLLVVGLIAVGVISYVVYKSFTSSTLSREECRARIISHCTSCNVAKWCAGPTVGETLANECGQFYSTTILISGADCEAICDFCKGFIPVSSCPASCP